MKIKTIRLYKGVSLPVQATEGSAGADLCAYLEEPLEISPGETKIVHLGFKAAIPEGYCGFVYARSGLATKNDLAPANKVGVIDSDYRGEWVVPLHNHGHTPQTVINGQRIAQVIIAPVFPMEFCETDTLDETKRGEHGFGSTG